MARQKRYVRQMPKIYGNLQKPARSYGWVGSLLKRIIFFGIILAVLYGLFFTGWFSIKTVEVEGAVFSDPGTAKSQVKLGSPIWALSQANVRNHVLQDPSVDAVSVYRGLPDYVKIVIKEKKPALIWVSGSTATVLDDTGQAFMQYRADAIPAPGTPVGNEIGNLSKIIDTKALPVAIGDQVVSPFFLAFVGSTKSELAASFPEFQMDHMEISDTTYDLTIIAKQGLQAKLNTLGDAGVQVRNLARLVDQKKAAMNSKIDLRIDRWAYVKQ